MKLVYPAIFKKEELGYSVVIPDLLGCCTQGDTLEDAIEMAEDAALGWLLTTLEENEEIPKASDINDIELENKDEFSRRFMEVNGLNNKLKLTFDEIKRHNPNMSLDEVLYAVYDEVIDIDLSSLAPMAACPHMPDRVKSVTEIGKIKVDQVCIGSCTNSSLLDMMKVAAILKGKTVHPAVSLSIAPGSKQVLNMISQNGALADMIDAGARILESACGPCIGMGQSPNSAGVSLRTFNRNFEGRSGTADAGIYLVSPEVAAASALTGYLTDPRDLGEFPEIKLPDEFIINDNMVAMPATPEEAKDVEVMYGPNIKPFPNSEPMGDDITAKAVLKVGDDITTDHIMPAGAKILPYRSNIPFLSQYCFGVCDKTFPERIKAEGKGIVIGGANYGQGSSREHAALVPLYLGVKAVITKSFARIHCANLINAGILPLNFANADDYDKISQGDELSLKGIKNAIINNEPAVLVNLTTGEEYELKYDLSQRQKDIILAGGLLNYTKSNF